MYSFTVGEHKGGGGGGGENSRDSRQTTMLDSGEGIQCISISCSTQIAHHCLDEDPWMRREVEVEVCDVRLIDS